MPYNYLMNKKNFMNDKHPMTTTSATPDFRALCAELLAALETEGYTHWTINPGEDPLCERARTALATPPPEPPTDEELLKLTENVSTKHMYAHKSLPSNWDFGDYCSSPQGLIDFARAVLERWGK